VLEELAIDPAFESGACHFLEKERAARFENPADLRNALLPVRHVVQRAEIEYRVEARVRKCQSLRVPLHKADLPSIFAFKTLPGPFDLCRIQVEPKYMRGGELPQNHFNSCASPASDFHHGSTLHSPAESSQERALIEHLHGRTHGIVDQQLFGKLSFMALPCATESILRKE